MSNKRALTDKEHTELIRLAWVNLRNQYQIMGEQLKEFGLLLAGYIEDQDKDERQKNRPNITKIHRLSRLSSETKEF